MDRLFVQEKRSTKPHEITPTKTRNLIVCHTENPDSTPLIQRVTKKVRIPTESNLPDTEVKTKTQDQALMSQILLERTAGRAVLTLNRPEKLNALSYQMREELKEILESLEKDQQLRILILTGAGDSAFCAGTDINELAQVDDSKAIQISQSGQRLCEQIESFPVPVIAVVNGIAAGGGFELVLACHLRVASSAASFSIPETRLGWIPGYGGTQRLDREIGVGRAVEWMLTRRTISGDEAFKLGLANRLVPAAGLQEEWIRLAKEIEQLSPLSIRACLKAISRGMQLPLAEGLALETELFASLFATEDAKEGTSAFLEKRTPVFTGK